MEQRLSLVTELPELKDDRRVTFQCLAQLKCVSLQPQLADGIAISLVCIDHMALREEGLAHSCQDGSAVRRTWWSELEGRSVVRLGRGHVQRHIPIPIPAGGTRSVVWFRLMRDTSAPGDGL